MEKNKIEEKNKKFISTLKFRMFKGYEKIRNKTNENLIVPKLKNSNNYYRTFDKSLNNVSEDNLSFNNKNKNHPFKTKYDNLKNFNITHLSKVKKDDYDFTLNKLFFTTSDSIKNKKLKKLNKDLLVNTNYDIKYDEENIKERSRLLNNLFPDINELNKYSDIRFFSLIKNPYPNKMKLDFILNKKRYKINQNEFLYKLSHKSEDKEKIKINKNKGIKKGVTTQYFHGVDKFCINNKISETNFPFNNKKLLLELDVENITKGGEKTSQISNKERRLKMLEKNINSIKSIPEELVDDLEKEVFKYLDEEFDKNDSMNKKDLNSKMKENENKIEKKDESIENNSNKGINIYIQTNDSINTSNYINTNNFKKPNKYPINFYSTQQLKKKEHFKRDYKITFEEREKMLKKEKEDKKVHKYKSGLILDNKKDLKRKKPLNNVIAYKKQCKMRDILIGNKLKNEYDEIDTKRILRGLKPWVFINADDKKRINLDTLKQKFNEDIKELHFFKFQNSN